MPNIEFTIDVRRDGERPVIAVRGEIDMYTAPRVRETLVNAINNGDPVVVADLTDVTFIDSTGLGVLIGVVKRCRTAGGDLVLTGMNPRTWNVMKLTGLDRVFTVEGVAHLSTA